MFKVNNKDTYVNFEQVNADWKHTLKSCAVNTERFWKYAWPFFSIMHKSV